MAFGSNQKFSDQSKVLLPFLVATYLANHGTCSSSSPFHPIMINNPRSFMFYFPPCRGYNGTKMTPSPEQWYTACFNRSHRDLYARRQQFFPFNAAVSNKPGFARFNLGAGDSGVGSLYEFKKGSKWERMKKWGWTQVPTIRMDHILQFVPDNITFEIVKIDAQGHDAEVVSGVGEFI
eukprot:EG_transcript_30237